jgi:3-oxoacid CoA-transferase
MERSITTDYALIKGHVADEAGNVVFNKTASNFNIDCAVAGKTCIVEVEEIVPTGSLRPEQIDLPHIYV